MQSVLDTKPIKALNHMAALSNHNLTKTIHKNLGNHALACLMKQKSCHRTIIQYRQRVHEAYHDLYNPLPRQGSSYLPPSQLAAVRWWQPGTIDHRGKLHALMSCCLLACFLPGTRHHAHHVDYMLEHAEHLLLLRDQDVHSSVEDG